MKYIKSFSLLVVSTLFIWGCADEPLPFETFEELQKGAFARLLEDDKGTFFFTDPENSAFSFTVEYYGDNNGGDIASHDWRVRHRNNITGEITDYATVTSTPSSSFQTNSKSGLPMASYSFNLMEALAALNLTLDDLNGGDDIIFDGFLVMNDGREFGPDNTGGSLQGGAGFDGVFRFQKPLLCTSALDGTYDLLATGWCGTEYSGQIRFEQTGDGEYQIFTTASDGSGDQWEDMSMGSYYACYETASPDNLPLGNLRLVDACGKLSYKGSSQWGEIYTFNSVTVNGPVLTIDWKNSYDPEAGVAVITRTDGSDWPALK